MLTIIGLTLWAYLMWQRLNMVLSIRDNPLLTPDFRAGFTVGAVIESVLITTIILLLVAAV